jgi:hypothetical protein
LDQSHNSKIHFMTPAANAKNSELQTALRAARENERRWREMHEEYLTDMDSEEQWAATAKLRRLEVERLEALLGETERE